MASAGGRHIFSTSRYRGDRILLSTRSSPPRSWCLDQALRSSCSLPASPDVWRRVRRKELVAAARGGELAAARALAQWGRKLQLPPQQPPDLANLWRQGECKEHLQK